MGKIAILNLWEATKECFRLTIELRHLRYVVAAAGARQLSACCRST